MSLEMLKYELDILYLYLKAMLKRIILETYITENHTHYETLPYHDFI